MRLVLFTETRDAALQIVAQLQRQAGLDDQVARYRLTRISIRVFESVVKSCGPGRIACCLQHLTVGPSVPMIRSLHLLSSYYASRSGPPPPPR